MLEPGNVPNVPEWMKDIGGWAVVLLIVRWMMTRIDTLIASSEGNMRAAIAEFKAFRMQEQDQHAEIEETQQEIISMLRHKRG